ncbi:hypothetical protein Bca4012_074926 [Brassica carinata]|uniref:(rape) hypothetical protein n=1 Tax=Brassica napus TaxID=3708 RepID=A0A816LLX5_BRANA|nr:unnamed protein product [Brassica napus]
MENPSDKVVVKWVNDTRGRVCWVILASLCLCGFTQLMEVFKDESQVIYKYVGMSLVSLYVILLVKSLCSDETPTIGYRSGSCLRSFVPLLFFCFIFITIYYHRTLGVSIHFIHPFWCSGFSAIAFSNRREFQQCYNGHHNFGDLCSLRCCSL